MAEQVMSKSGTFCWNELATKDLGAAKKFYTELLGWQLEESNVAGMSYIEIVVGGEHIGGMYQMTAEDGDRPSHWMSYVEVEDVDDRAKKAAELGGKVCVPPTDIPNVGRFCVITDPAGATFSLVKLLGHSG
jgi:predicted enzyme related to lactoylglutathione lyase